MDNTISGYGTFGTFGAAGSFHNDTGGTIDADGASQMTIASGNTFVNAGLMEGADDKGAHGALVITDNVTNTGGTIEAKSQATVETYGGVTGGTIEAVAGGILALNGSSTGSTIEAVSGGALALNGSSSGSTILSTNQTGDTSQSIVVVDGATRNSTFDASGSDTAGNQALIVLSGAIQGGTFETGALGIVLADNITLDSTSTNVGTLSVDEIGIGRSATANTLTLKSGLTNAGTITLAGPDVEVALLIASATTTLQGGGQIKMSDGDQTVIDATTAGDTLVNVDNVISGNGSLGLGNLVLNNQGTVNATGASPMLVSLNARTASTNTGTMEATGGGELDFLAGKFTNNGIIDADGTSDVEFAKTATITNNVGGTIEATNGGAIYLDAVTRHAGYFTNQATIEAAGAGSTVSVAQGATTNDVGGTLTGGAWFAYAGGTITLTGAAITTDAAAITLSGTGSELLSGTGSTIVTIQQSLKTIAAGGSLTIGNVPYTFANAITLNGTLYVGSPPTGQGGTGSFTSGLITASAGSLIRDTYGNGTIASSLTDAATVSVNTGTLSFTGANDTFSGSFTSTNTLFAVIAFTAGTDTLARGVKLSNASSLINGAKLVLGASLIDNGNLSMSSGTLSLGSSTLTVAGAFLGTNPLGTSAFSGGTVLGPGTLAFGAKASSTFAGVTFSGASLSNSGTLTLSGALTLGGASGATDTISNKSGATFALANGGSIGVATGVTGKFANSGTLEKIAGTAISTVSGTMTNAGTIVAGSGTLEIAGAIGGTGQLNIAGGTLKLDATPSATQTITYQGAGTLALKATGTLNASIAGFATGDKLDLLTMAGATVTSFTEASGFASGTLVVTAGKVTDTFTLAGSYTAANFVTGKDASGTGTAITYQATAAVKKDALVAKPAAAWSTPTWENLFATHPTAGMVSASTVDHAPGSGLAHVLFQAAFDHGFGANPLTHASLIDGSSHLAAALEGIAKGVLHHA